MRKKITECNDEHVLNELKDCIKHCSMQFKAGCYIRKRQNEYNEHAAGDNRQAKMQGSD